MTTREVLVAARALIATPERWTKETSSWVRNGIECFCAIGAIGRAVDHDHNAPATEDVNDALRAAMPAWFLDRRTGRPSIVEFNDAPTTTHADVLQLFDRAIAACDEGK